MPTKAVFELTPSTTLSVLPSYDQTKWNAGHLFKRGTLASPAETFIQPFPVQIHRPMELPTPVAILSPHAVRFSTTMDWIFVADGQTAGATRRIGLYTFDRTTFTLTWKGYTVVTFPVATNLTIRGIRAVLDRYTTGTAAVSGTAVTGTGTAWQTSRLCVGNRIGFGSTDPAQISTWYEIGAIGSDTGITLTESAGTIGDGAYVIEDLRVAIATTNATTTNGGLMLLKGLRFEHFTGGGTTVPAATTVDNIRACYWLADASTVTNTVSLGVAVDEKTDWQNQDCYVPNGTATFKVFKYNLRKDLTLASGKDLTAFLLGSGNNTLTGTASQINNIRIGSFAHGDGSGVKSLWITSTTRIYRIPVTRVTSGATDLLTAELPMLENPPGTTNTHAATATLNNLEIVDSLDRLLLFVSGAVTPFRSYLTKWIVDGGPITKYFMADVRHLDTLASSADVPYTPSHFALPLSSWAENGILYIARVSASATYNQFYVLPIGADEENAVYANQVVMSPAIDTSNMLSFSKFMQKASRDEGSHDLGFPADPIHMYYRVSGISDNSGAWTEIPEDGDLSGVAVTGSIQFMWKWNIAGNLFVFPKLYGFALTYNDNNDMPPYYRWYLADSDNAAGVVGFIQTLTSSYTVLTIRYYKASDDSLLLEQASSGSTNGYFEYWDGDSWEAGLGSDAAGVRRRFTPTAGLPASTPVYVRITGA